MSIKYYTHFLLQERAPKGLSEFRGVVEVNKGMSRGDLKEAATVASFLEVRTVPLRAGLLRFRAPSPLVEASSATISVMRCV